MKCDFLQAEGTCNNEHGDPSGRCFTHRNMPGLTLRDLFTKLEACGLREESERAKYEAALTRGRAKIAALIAERVDIQAALTGDLAAKAEAVEIAWGIIANAYGGDWSKASPEWREAAERWRDEHVTRRD